MRWNTPFFFILILIAALNISIASACNPDNAFITGDNVTLCLGQGTFLNSTGNYDMEGSEECAIYVYYPNNTNIVSDQNMSFVDNRFQYNLGVMNTPGIYNSFTYCYKGSLWWAEWWDFNIYANNCTGGEIRLENGSCSEIIVPGQCDGSGEKLQWNGSAYLCVNETDPRWTGNYSDFVNMNNTLNQLAIDVGSMNITLNNLVNQVDSVNLTVVSLQNNISLVLSNITDIYNNSLLQRHVW